MTVLIIDGHPDLTRSTANALILSSMQQDKGCCISHLSESAWIVEQEQQALLNASLIVIQFPLYWSAFPAVLKQWVDEVFTYGFAFGPNGSQLKNKPIILSITAGAKADSYREGGFNFMPFSDYLQALMHPFKAAEMTILEPIISFEMNANPDEGGNRFTCQALATAHTQQLQAAIAAVTM
ncbi:MAG: NAD(P)H-dependent oxidoreductase [Ferrimonas sp.]